MKKITNLMMLFAVALFAACDETIETPDTLEVKPYNLEGAWKLDKVDGSALAEGTYVYVVLDRECEFKIYQNTATMYPILYTGTYALGNEWRYGDVISGVYDCGQGKWENEYIITDLYEKKSMTWTVKIDAAKNPSVQDATPEVQTFLWVDKVPDYIVEAVRLPIE